MIDTIIVGAGPSGLCAAKTILQCNPTAELLILDAGSTIGGVWAKEKLYPSLKTNTFFGSMDFSDFKMPIGHGATPDDHIPGMSVHQFLDTYAQHFNITNKIQFNTRVIEAERTASGTWRLKIQSPNGTTLECLKLIIGMGVNNRPHKPEFVGASDFDAPILHSSELNLHYQRLIHNPTINKIAILGGGKSAYDAANMASAAGKHVEWITRKSGKGPVWVFPMQTKVGPITIRRDKMALRRIITFLSPSLWNDGFRWIRNLLHRTKLGMLITSLFWTKLHTDTIEDCGYRRNKHTALLQPEKSFLYYGTAGGSCKYLPELFDRIVRGQIHIYREDITHLSQHSIHLKDGRVIDADALITATGFSTEPTIDFVPSLSHSDLGIPTTHTTIDQQKFWATLDSQSDVELLRRFPNLVGTQHTTSKEVKTDHTCTPFRLYRSLVPPGLTTAGDKSLVFLGVFSNLANHTRLEIQCLWAYAYLNGKLRIDEKSVYKEASMLSRYSRHRTPMGHGCMYPDHVFDQLPYFDTLLGDLGLSSRRKGNWFAEVFGAYHVTDYRGIVQEWLSKQQAQFIQTNAVRGG